MSDRYMSAFPWQPDAQETGMTLRDYIAVQAMAGLLTTGQYGMPLEELAEYAYQHADAMLKVRSN